MTDTIPSYPPDIESQRSSTFSVLTVSFGDGYSQRKPQGINSVKDSYTLTWTGLNRTKYDDLYGFLFDTKGVTAFYWTPSQSETQSKWIVTDLSSSNIGYKLWTVNATVEEVFDE